MGTIDPKDLLKKWIQHDLTIEMAIGHILQHLVLLYDTDKQAAITRSKYKTAVEAVNISQATLRDDVDRLLTKADMESSQNEPPKRKRGRPRKKQDE
ncbi:hypothetical protein QUF63_00155 [Anaerolineales bacterium HSG25]|nr:hypothetical protein [Anaerolineales bacterium HSG25]